MRKLFSILAVALFALSAHATVVTKDFDLSGFDKDRLDGISWNAETKVISAENGDWPAIQKWETIETTDYEELVLELAETSLIGINLWVQYSDNTQANVTIAAGETSKALPLKPLSLSAIKIIATAAGSATLSKLYLKGVAGKVTEEAVTFDQYNNDGALGSGDDAWNNSIQAWSGSFSSLGLQVDDKLVIKYTLSGSDDQFRILACADAENVFDFASANGSCINPEAGSTSIAFPLNSADLTKLTSKGIKIDGKNMTITGISVLKHAVLWTGEQVIGDNWSNTVDIPVSKLSDLQVGNILCIRVSAIGTEAGPRVTLAYGDSWNSFNPTVEYYFQGGDEAPMEVEFPITYKMEQQLRGNKLVIRGVNYTVTDIYVKEGTPTNTVAGYLNVTEAGMATLVLPFNVPTLPNGVQAYNLTNNGDATIMATEVQTLEADKPVLIVAAEGEYQFVSEDGASDDISGKTSTYANGALIGTYVGINPIPVSALEVNNYILQNGSEGVAFYQVTAANCSIPAYRAYLSCGYNASNAGPNPAPMRIVFHQDATTGVENLQGNQIPCTKVFKNGVLYIKYNGIMYNVQGQLCK